MFVSLKDFLGDMRKTARRQKGMKIKKGKKRELGQMITCTKLCLLHEEILLQSIQGVARKRDPSSQILITLDGTFKGITDRRCCWNINN